MTTSNSATGEILDASISDYWRHPAVIAPSEFKMKSLCDFSFNSAIGCSHGCRFCYVPSTSANKQAPFLEKYGITDPDAEWGNYVLVRPWDEDKFLASLAAAENTPVEKLKPDGNRAILFSSTTDPYQVIRNRDTERQKTLNGHHRAMVRRALTLIRDHSTLNVRILTRSPLAKKDFDLFKSFGSRLMFGMSVPTLNETLARVFEPNAPSVKQRLTTLEAAKEADLNIYVAMAPTYPDCDEDDIRATLTKIAKLDPLTVFHEPINIRAENVERMRQHGLEEGVALDLTPFDTRDGWRRYSIEQMKTVERVAAEVGLDRQLHLWVDKDIPTKAFLEQQAEPSDLAYWCQKWWSRISEWPE